MRCHHKVSINFICHRDAEQRLNSIVRLGEERRGTAVGRQRQSPVHLPISPFFHPQLGVVTCCCLFASIYKPDSSFAIARGSDHDQHALHNNPAASHAGSQRRCSMHMQYCHLINQMAQASCDKLAFLPVSAVPECRGHPQMRCTIVQAQRASMRAAQAFHLNTRGRHIFF